MRTILAELRAVHRAVGVRGFSTNKPNNMKFVQFAHQDKSKGNRVGVLSGDGVVDLNEHVPNFPCTMLEALKTGAAYKVDKSILNKTQIPKDKIEILAPINAMDKVLCIGLNYRDHCIEQNKPIPENPIIFSKFPNCIVSSTDTVLLRNQITTKVDLEVELVVVIGKEAVDVKKENAWDYVFGYTVAQDISARDWQKSRNGGQFLLGKAMDTFCPLGPSIVTSDEVGNPEELDIECKLNGQTMQKSNTCQLVHKIDDLIVLLSSLMTLLPGDIILTGTPGGVGMYRDPPVYLKHGDTITSTIANIGTMTNPVCNYVPRSLGLVL